jgi:putative ABC transport system permease protein
MTALYSINLRIMGRPNIALLTEPTVFSYFQGSHSVLLAIAGIVLLIVLFLYIFLASRFGLAVRATGINPRVSPSYGINVGMMTLIGLSLSNGLVALAGALFAQAHGFADISLGTGTLIAGLATVILGESLLSKHHMLIVLISCVLGSILYRLVIALALNSQIVGLQSSDQNLITAILVVIAMLAPQLRQKIAGKSRRNL